jgi:hypothetical protein
MHNEKEREKRSGGAAHPERKHKASLHSLLLQPKQTLSVCGGTVSAQCGHGEGGGVGGNPRTTTTRDCCASFFQYF